MINEIFDDITKAMTIARNQQAPRPVVVSLELLHRRVSAIKEHFNKPFTPVLLESVDAVEWASSFVRTMHEQGWSINDIDEGLMIAWFANCMAAQEDHDDAKYSKVLQLKLDTSKVRNVLKSELNIIKNSIIGLIGICESDEQANEDDARE